MVRSEISLVALFSVNQLFASLFQDWYLAGRNPLSLVVMLLVTRCVIYGNLAGVLAYFAG